MNTPDNSIHERSVGYTIIPSDGLMSILEKMETSVLKVFQSSRLQEDLGLKGTNKLL